MCALASDSEECVVWLLKHADIDVNLRERVNVLSSILHAQFLRLSVYSTVKQLYIMLVVMVTRKSPQLYLKEEQKLKYVTRF